MKRIFLDANVLVSGIVFKGLEHELLKAGIRKDAILVTSEDVIGELLEVLERKFPAKARLAGESLKLAEIKVVHKEDYAELVPLQKLRDLNYRHVLAAALAARCVLLVTGDKDILSAEAQGIKIVAARKALRALRKARGHDARHT